MAKCLVTEIISITLFLIGGILISLHADWELSLGIILFVSAAKIDVIYRIEKKNEPTIKPKS